MAFTLKHYEFIDKTLLPIFYFKSVQDYTTKISINELKNKADFLQNINNILNDIKELFVVKEFSLHKYDGKIKTESQAFGILKKCLQLLNINYVIDTIKGIKYLRLTDKNVLLNQYIENTKMTEFRVSEWFNSSLVPDNPISIPKKQIPQSEIQKFIKKTIDRKFIIILSDTDDYLNIDLKPLYTESTLSSIKFDLRVGNEYDPYITKNTTFDEVSILIDGDHLCDSKYVNEQNILPNGLLMLPISLTLFSQYTIKLKYGRNFKPIAHNISKHVTLEMTISEIIFKKSFKNDVRSSSIFDFDDVFFYTSANKATHWKDKSVKILTNAKCDMEKFEAMRKEMNEKKGIEYDPYVFGNYKGGIVKEINNECSINGLSLMIHNNFDFAAEKIRLNINNYSREILDGCCVLKFQLVRAADIIVVNKIKFKCNVGEILNTKIKLVNVAMETMEKEKHNFIVNNVNGETELVFVNPVKINMVGSQCGSFLCVTVENIHWDKSHKIELSGEYIYLETQLRKKFAGTMNCKLEQP